MALRLTIVSQQREALGSRASFIVGSAGGTIGRGRDNDWVLSDPNCYLSAHHARIECRRGTFYLLDTSSNGVYVNGGTVALGRRNTYPLRDGDRLRMGDFLIGVRVEADAEQAPEASAIYPVTPQLPSAGAEPSEPDIGVALDLQELLGTVTPASTGPRAVDAFGQQVLTEDTGLLAFDRGSQSNSSGATAAPSARSRAELRAAVQALAARPEPQASGARAPSISDPAAVDAFCHGAGIDAARLAGEPAVQLLHRAGLLLRVVLGGLKGLALAQRELRDQSRIKLERKASSEPQPPPDMGALELEELLLQLLSVQQHQLDVVQWLRDSVDGMRQHELALLRALHSALAEFVGRLDPRALAQTAPERTGVGPEESSGLTARFRTITDMSGGALPHLFAEAFARAFAVEYPRDGSAHADVRSHSDGRS
jgi:type VI secretion system protein